MMTNCDNKEIRDNSFSFQQFISFLKGKKVYVIPKIGYSHKLGRTGSLIEGYKNTIDEKESNFWVNVARKEQFYKEERDASKFIYNPNEESTSDD